MEIEAVYGAYKDIDIKDLSKIRLKGFFQQHHEIKTVKGKS